MLVKVPVVLSVEAVFHDPEETVAGLTVYGRWPWVGGIGKLVAGGVTDGTWDFDLVIEKPSTLMPTVNGKVQAFEVIPVPKDLTAIRVNGLVHSKTLMVESIPDFGVMPIDDGYAKMGGPDAFPWAIKASK